MTDAAAPTAPADLPAMAPEARREAIARAVGETLEAKKAPEPPKPFTIDLEKAHGLLVKMDATESMGEDQELERLKQRADEILKVKAARWHQILSALKDSGRYPALDLSKHWSAGGGAEKGSVVLSRLDEDAPKTKETA